MKIAKQEKKRTIIILFLILISIAAYFSWGKLNHEAETYSSAEIRCGQKPVIGADKDEYNKDRIYYAPGPPDESTSYDLLSLYDPANIDLSEYANPKFFCNIEQAKSAGYVKHQCCGAIKPE